MNGRNTQLVIFFLLILIGLVGYIAYRSYQDSFEYKTINDLGDLRYGIPAPTTEDIEVGYVTPDGWEVCKIANVPSGYTITYRRKKQ